MIRSDTYTIHTLYNIHLYIHTYIYIYIILTSRAQAIWRWSWPEKPPHSHFDPFIEIIHDIFTLGARAQELSSLPPARGQGIQMLQPLHGSRIAVVRLKSTSKRKLREKSLRC